MLADARSTIQALTHGFGTDANSNTGQSADAGAGPSTSQPPADAAVPRRSKRGANSDRNVSNTTREFNIFRSPAAKQRTAKHDSTETASGHPSTAAPSTAAAAQEAAEGAAPSTAPSGSTAQGGSEAPPPAPAAAAGTATQQILTPSLPEAAPPAPTQLSLDPETGALVLVQGDT